MRLPGCGTIPALTDGGFFLHACEMKSLSHVLPVNLVFVFALLLGSSVASRTNAGSTRITVSAGEWDRTRSLVSMGAAPNGGQGLSLRDAQGTTIPLQVDAAGHMSFIVEHLPKGSRAIYQLAWSHDSARPQHAATMLAERAGTKLKISAAGRPVLEYQAEPGELPRPEIGPIFRRGGYIHPVFSPSGRLLTDDFPPDHHHHHGIWTAWTRTEFEGRQPDFWNVGQGRGRVEFVALNHFWSGPVHAGFRARQRYVDLTAGEPIVVLHESWEARVHASVAGGKTVWMLDLVFSQECATAAPLTLPKYHYGGLGFRGHADWIGKTKQPFLTSEGIEDKLRGNETRGRWCHVGGLVDGQPAGVVVMDHPSNFRSPQPMRLNPDQPFFCFAPQQLGVFQITPGQPYISRYRLVFMDGPPDSPAIDRLWQDYAHPPRVEIERVAN